MRRCLIPGIIALSIHGLLFAMEFKWPVAVSFPPPKVAAITMTLSYFQPDKPRSSVAAPKPAPVPKQFIKKVTLMKAAPKATAQPKPDFILLPKPKADPVTKKRSRAELQPEKIEIRSEQEPIQIPLEISDKKTSVALIPNADQQPKAPLAPVIRKAKPLYRRNPPPRYPLLARKRKYQGVVILKVFVNPEGSVGEIKVFKSSGYAILDTTALRSVRKWEFAPGRRGDEKVGMWVRVPVRYRLK